MTTPPLAPAAVRHGWSGGVGIRIVISEKPMIDLNKCIQNAKGSHILWGVGALYAIYYWNFIVTVALIVGAVWLIGKLSGDQNR